MGPYVVNQVHENGCYSLVEMDGSPLKNKIAGKRIKIFKRRNKELTLVDVAYEMCLFDSSKARGSQAKMGEDV